MVVMMQFLLSLPPGGQLTESLGVACAHTGGNVLEGVEQRSSSLSLWLLEWRDGKG